MPFDSYDNEQVVIRQPFCGPRGTEMVHSYKATIEKENLYEAFKALKMNKIPGLSGNIKTSYTKQLVKSIVKLNKELRSHKYKPSPIKVVPVERPGGGKRYFGVPSIRDKIVQAAFKKELEQLYEPLFRDFSYGYRPNRSCHSVLKQIKKYWYDIKWLISLAFVKSFEKSQQEVLIKSLKKKIDDQETIDLL